jgi:hypothetical protein
MVAVDEIGVVIRIAQLWLTGVALLKSYFHIASFIHVYQKVYEVFFVQFEWVIVVER